MIQQAEPPVKNLYYKYRPLYKPNRNGSRVIHDDTASIFTKSEIYFSAPTDFNDPFDSNLPLHVNDSTDAEWEKYFDEQIEKRPELENPLRNIKDGKLWKTNRAISENFNEEGRIEIYIGSSVFCLSKKNNSIPMFSYYADGHTGIAIEFAFSDYEVPCGFDSIGLNGAHYGGKVTFRDVDYPSVFPELNYHRIRNTDKLVRRLMFTKSSEWVHEAEFRIFRKGIAKSSVPFDRKLISKVIFGCKTTSADIDLVKSWLKNWPSDVVLSKAEPATDKFELLIKDFDVVKGV